MNGENKKSKENRKREENKKSIITSVFAVIILIGVFLIYSSYSKMLRLQAELKLQEAKEKIKKIEENEQKQAETQQNLQKDIQKVEETVANAVTQQTNYEEELMKRMSSVKDTDFEGSTAEMAEQAEKARKAWDDELNKVYKLLMS